MELYFKKIDSPIGKLTIYADDKGLRALEWPHEKRKALRLPKAKKMEDHKVLKKAEKQITEYFNGKRKKFSIELSMEGTPFQKQVWTALLTIPFGETRSYGELASQIQKPKASRAVGAANGRNPLSIIVPCHRVIGSNGSLTGFAGGVDIKEKLLNFEGSL